MTGRRWQAARWAIGIGVVALLAASLDPAALASRLASADLRLAAIGIAGLTAVHLIPAETWRLLCLRLGAVRLEWRDSVVAYYAAQALGGVTPGNIGGDLYRIHALRRSDGGLDAAVAPVVVQRATSYLALSILGVAAVAFLAAQSGISLLLVVPAVAVAIFGAALAGLLLTAGGPFQRIRRAAMRLVGGGAAVAGHEWRGRLARGAGAGLLLGLLFHAVSVLLTALLVAAVSPQAVTPASIAALAVARLSLAIPVSPSGLGVQEGALSALFIGIGMAPETALAALLLARISLLTTTLAGALAFGIRGPRRPAAVRHSADPAG